MRTIRTKVYKFNELSDEAKEKAIDWCRNVNNDIHDYEDIVSSAKAVADLFDLKFGKSYTDIRFGHIEDRILELSGTRLYKYVVNNYYDSLFTPKYIKTIGRELKCKQFICKIHTGANGKFTQLFSKLTKVNDGCALTGMCYDDDILQPVYEFLKNPDKSTTFEDLIKDIENAISKTLRDIEEWVNSDEYITEQIEANEYEFTQDGNLFR